MKRPPFSLSPEALPCRWGVASREGRVCTQGRGQPQGEPQGSRRDPHCPSAPTTAPGGGFRCSCLCKGAAGPLGVRGEE